MSFWIHVIGAFVTGETEEKLRNVMGTPVPSDVIYPHIDYDDPLREEKYEENHKKVEKLFEIEQKEREENRAVPYGSEGTLNYIINKDNKVNIIGEGTNVYIQGDLRDVSTADEVIDWIKRIVENCEIRDVVVKIECDFSDTVIIHGSSYTGLNIINIPYEDPYKKN